MRATISFDIDLDKVEETMSSLVTQESHTLRVAANILSNADRTTLLEEVNEALDLVQQATSQLQQYRDMLVSFEKAKYETMLPQPAPVENIINMQDKLEAIQKFGNFVERINSSEETETPDETVEPA